MGATRQPSLPGSAPFVISVAKASGDEKARPDIPLLPLSFSNLKIDTHLRPRSASMHRKLADHKWNVTPKNGKPFLEDKYLIVDGTNTDFNSTDIASIGGNINREIIILNPKHELLDQQFQALKKIVEKFKQIHDHDAVNDIDILEIALRYTREAIQYHEKETNKIIDDAPRVPNKPLRIPLEVFVEHGVGVCRHQALLLAYLIDRLIQEKYLSPYLKVYLHRDDITGGAHTWVIVKNELTDQIIYLDPANFDVAFNLRKFNERTKPLELLGDNSFTRCMQRYSNTALPYKQIKNDNDKEEFLLALLNQQEIVRLRIFLQLQHAENSLAQIKQALKQDEVLMKHENYERVLAEIVRIERVNKISQFSELRSITDKEQFIIALLLKKPHELQEALQNQSLSSLAQMLTMQSPTLEQVQLELPFYKELFEKIRAEFARKKPIEEAKRAHLELLKKLCTAILGTILTEKLIIEPASNSCCTFFSSQPGKKIEVGSFNKRIPTEAFQYYEMLAKVKLNNATLEELTALMGKINTAAEKSAQKANDANHSFYDILKNKNHKQMMLQIKQFNEQQAHRRPAL